MAEAIRLKPATGNVRLLVAGIAGLAALLYAVGVQRMTGVPGGMSTQAAGAGVPAAETALPSTQPNSCAQCGTVEAIRTVEVREEIGPEPRPAPSGTTGESTRIAEILDAVVGRDVGGTTRKRITYRVTVRMNDGSYRALSLAEPPALGVGDKVRIVEGRLVRA